MGYQFDSKFHYRVFKTGEAWKHDYVKFVEGSSVDGIDLAISYEGKIPDQISVSFDQSDNFLKMKIMVPVYSNFYNEKTETMELGQVGFAVAEERLSKSFVEKMGRIMGMKMNLFVNDAFSVGDFPAYKTVNISDIPKFREASFGLRKQPFYFEDVQIASLN